MLLFSCLSLFLAAQLPGAKPSDAKPPVTSPKPAVTPKPVAPKYRYLVTPETTQHLDSVGPKEIKQVSWDLKNTSDKPIAFRVLDTAPGVLMRENSFTKPWQPGESRKIEATCDPSGWVGYQRRAIKLEADDPKEPRYNLSWDMTVRPELTVDAVTKAFGDVGPHESPLVAFTFTRESSEPAEIHLASTLPDYLESEIVSTGPKAVLNLTLRTTKLKPGVHAGLELLKVTTNAPKQPTFDLTLSWKLKFPIITTPSRVVWDDPQIRGFKLSIKSRNDKPFHILEARIEGPSDPQGNALFTHGPLSKDDAAEHELKLICLADEECKAMLFLTCTNMDEPLQIPLTWLPPKGQLKEKKPWDDTKKVEPESGH